MLEAPVLVNTHFLMCHLTPLIPLQPPLCLSQGFVCVGWCGPRKGNSLALPWCWVALYPTSTAIAVLVCWGWKGDSSRLGRLAAHDKEK